MKNLLNKIPYPIAGVMLAYAALGNFLGVVLGEGVGEFAKNLCGSIAGVILVLLLLKLIISPKSLKAALEQLPVAGVLVTFPMGLMLLSVYLKPIIGSGAIVVWIVGLVINVMLVLYFTLKHVWPFKLQKVLANYFVTYVGIVIASVTAGAFDMKSIGIAAFVFGLVVYGIILPVVSYRYIKKPVEQEPIKPMVLIFAAPANLLVVGYAALGLQWSNALLIVLWVIGFATTLFGWHQIYKLKKLPFYPSYSAYTFPLVIGAMATLRFGASGIITGSLFEIFRSLAYAQGIIATFMVVYVTFRYFRLVVAPEPVATVTSTKKIKS